MLLCVRIVGSLHFLKGACHGKWVGVAIVFTKKGGSIKIVGWNKKIGAGEVFAWRRLIICYTAGGGRVANYVENMYHNKDSQYM